MNFSSGCDDAVREAITQSGINNGASTHICVRKTDIDEEIWNKLKIKAFSDTYKRSRIGQILSFSVVFVLGTL